MITALPGPVTGLTDVEFIVNVRLRLDELLLLTLDSQDACKQFAESGTHSHLCGALSGMTIRRHDDRRDAWKPVAASGSVSISSEPYVRRGALGIPGKPAREHPRHPRQRPGHPTKPPLPTPRPCILTPAAPTRARPR